MIYQNLKDILLSMLEFTGPPPLQLMQGVGSSSLTCKRPKLYLQICSFAKEKRVR